jgi:hypothetical protein
MAIRESWVPGEGMRYRVIGDPRPFRNFPTREKAEQKEAELAAAGQLRKRRGAA